MDDSDMTETAENMPTTPNLTDVKNADSVVLNPTSTVFDDQGKRASRFNARKAAVFVADLNAVALALLVANIIHQWLRPFSEDQVSATTYFWLFVFTFPVWPISFTRNYLYRARHIARSADEAERVVKAIFYGFLAILTISIFSQVIVSRVLVVEAFILMVLFVGIERAIARYLFKRARSN
ncbi:MAG: FlaA1/EpsC-like NDP-sugar epimerase, partial [Verrucomicrobiales bacterium]